MNHFFAWLNGPEVIVLLVIVLILFGAKKLPELAKGLGQGIKEFKKSSREVQEEFNSAMDTEQPPSRPAPRKLPAETQPRTEYSHDPSSSEHKV